MQKNIISTIVYETENINDLTSEDQRLVSEAQQAADNSWSPYSHFAVGAAVRLSDGTIVRGCNIENAAFPSGICAEHNALSTAAASYPGIVPVAMAITAYSRGTQVNLPVSPCGKCRQVIAEEETRHNQPMKIIMAGRSKIVVVEKGCDLLPLLFSKDYLNGNIK
ncbi:MAG: cytidine deaminase [Bacteroidales bacterium]|nr:cytidine deaminase [Bacteroidales bacterium]